MLDKRVLFVTESASGQDENCNAETETKTVEAYAEFKAPTRTEFYQANQAGYKISAVLRVYKDTYNGAPFVVSDGKKYRIIRAYPVSSVFTELSVEEVI